MQKLRLLFLSAFQLLDQARYKGASWSLTAYTAFYRFVNMTGVAAGVAARGVVTRCTQPFCRRRLAAELGSDGGSIGSSYPSTDAAASGLTPALAGGLGIGTVLQQTGVPPVSLAEHAVSPAAAESSGGQVMLSLTGFY